MRAAKRVDQLAIGSKVKVLIKTYSSYKVFPGVIVGFEPFEQRPTIVICYLEKDYNSARIQFLYYNSSTEDAEIVAAIDDCEDLLVERDFVLESLDGEILKKQEEIETLKQKREYFLKHFNTYFEEQK